MMRLWILLITAVGLSMPAQVAAAERKFSVFGFDSIRVNGSIDIEIVSGKGVSASASADNQRILDRVSLRKSGNELTVSVKPKTDRKNQFSVAEPITLRLSTYALKKITHLGSGKITVDRLSGRNVQTRIGGFGTVSVGDVDSDVLTIAMTGGGILRVAGETGEAKLSLLGASTFDGTDLNAEKLDLTQRGPSSTIIAVEREAEITNAGSGTIEILGRPNCLVRSAGAAQITCDKN